MPKDLEINIVRNGACSVVHIHGEIDLKTSPELRDALLDLFRKRSQERVILDFQGVTYIDSSGVASLIEGLHEAKTKKARLILANLGDSARHVLDLTRLTSVFEIAKTVEDALR
jgi:anti-sigma B factor antagonist